MNQINIMQKKYYFVDVLLAHNIDNDLTYKIYSENKPTIGSVIMAPLKSKHKIGIIVAVKEQVEISENKIKNIVSQSIEKPLNRKIIKFLEWVSSYNCIKRGLVLKMILSQEKYYFKKNQIKNEHIVNTVVKETVKLSDKQETVVKKLSKICKSNQYTTTLLDGVPGSGKTEIYFEIVREKIEENNQVLIMFPEVSLSNEFVIRLEKRFGLKPEVWHSKISPSQKKKSLDRIIKGESKIVIGARSSLFLPFSKLGLIIIDEEHDTSFKQEEQGIYHARDMSVVRATIEKIPLILVSATPSLESKYNVLLKKYHRVTLKEKYFSNLKLITKIIDMSKEKLKKDQWVSNSLKAEIESALKVRKQSLLFINKRGYAPVIICKSCGYKFACKNCSSYMVEHVKKRKLLCHHCGHNINNTKIECINCDNKNENFIDYGVGVEKVFSEISKLFPLSKVCILSSDHIKSQEDMAMKVNEIQKNKYDIIIGTQIITKGYHFPDLACVGIIDADMTLRGGDIRASEKTYQLLYQVAGRAGRAQTQGKVIIQTYNPANETILSFKNLDRDQFYENEITYRRENQLPPIGKMASLIISGNNEVHVRKQCSFLSQTQPHIESLEIYGPAPAPLSRLKGKFRQRFLIHDKKARNMQKIVNSWLSSNKPVSGVNVFVDIDPYSFV